MSTQTTLTGNEVVVVSLGWCLARLHKDKLVIVSPAYSGDDYYDPAEGVTIHSVPSLVALRDLLVEHLRETP